METIFKNGYYVKSSHGMIAKIIDKFTSWYNKPIDEYSERIKCNQYIYDDSGAFIDDFAECEGIREKYKIEKDWSYLIEKNNYINGKRILDIKCIDGELVFYTTYNKAYKKNEIKELAIDDNSFYKLFYKIEENEPILFKAKYYSIHEVHERIKKKKRRLKWK